MQQLEVKERYSLKSSNDIHDLQIFEDHEKSKKNTIANRNQRFLDNLSYICTINTLTNSLLICNRLDVKDNIEKNPLFYKMKIHILNCLICLKKTMLECEKSIELKSPESKDVNLNISNDQDQDEKEQNKLELDVLSLRNNLTTKSLDTISIFDLDSISRLSKKDLDCLLESVNDLKITIINSLKGIDDMEKTYNYKFSECKKLLSKCLVILSKSLKIINYNIVS